MWHPECCKHFCFQISPVKKFEIADKKDIATLHQKFQFFSGYQILPNVQSPGDHKQDLRATMGKIFHSVIDPILFTPLAIQ